MNRSQREVISAYNFFIISLAVVLKKKGKIECINAARQANPSRTEKLKATLICS